MATPPPEPTKKRWKIFPHGEGLPLSIFDLADEEDEVRSDKTISPFVSNGIAITVTLVWATSFIADIASTEYQPPTAIHVAFMVVIGAIFGFQFVQGKGGDKDV